MSDLVKQAFDDAIEYRIAKGDINKVAEYGEFYKINIKMIDNFLNLIHDLDSESDKYPKVVIPELIVYNKGEKVVVNCNLILGSGNGSAFVGDEFIIKDDLGEKVEVTHFDENKHGIPHKPIFISKNYIRSAK